MHSNSRERYLPALPLAALLLLAMCAHFACSAPEEGGSPAATESAGTAAADSDPVASLASYASELPAEGTITADMLGEALRRLAGAAGAAGVVPLEVTVDLRVSAEHVLLNPESPEVAMTVSATLGTLTEALGKQMPGEEAARVRAATDAIDAKAPLTGQAAALREYFESTAAALARVRG